MVVVDFAWPVEFRSPMCYSILVPYLLLFFGAILLMGLPMFRLNRMQDYVPFLYVDICDQMRYTYVKSQI